MRQVRIADRLRYSFDNSMARGPIALIGYLGLASLALIVVAAGAVVLLHIVPEGERESPPFFEAAWQSLLRTLDAGTMGDDKGPPFRGAMLFAASSS